MDFEQRFRVPAKGFHLADRDPGDVAGLTEARAVAMLQRHRERLGDLQERLRAEQRRALLVVLQGLDASGKDGTIKHVMGCLNPQAVNVTSFKAPTPAETAHDFLWRAQIALPERGLLGVFNRSHYEEVLVVRVHPEFLGAQGIDPADGRKNGFWRRRFKDIRSWERHLVRDGTHVVKFFLHLSRDEQRRRFLARVEEEHKNWKFRADDVRERRFWDAYQAAYEDALRHTSTDVAPWYVIPADHKWFLRTAVADIIRHHLEALDPQFPEPTDDERRAMEEAVAELRAEVSG
jgi:PPK2 family polyphosphate:nucleotide phosphotransferase